MTTTEDTKWNVTADDGVVEVLHWDGGGEGRDTVICLPAMGVPASYYEPLSRQLRAAGFAVVRGELRGHGESPIRAGRGVDFGYQELVETALPTMVEEVRGRLRPKRLFLLGHSLGGHLAMLFASRQPDAIDGIAMVASGTVYWRAWSGLGGLKILLVTQIFAVVARTLGYFPGDKIGFASREARRQMLDWARCGRSGRWRLGRSTFDYESAFPRVETPILGISLEGDTFAPPASLEFHLGKLAGAPVTHQHLTGAESAPEGLHHFRWARHPQAVVDAFTRWSRD